MEVQPDNQDQEKKPQPGQQGQKEDNEALAKEIPTVTPDDDNLEAGPEDESTDK